MTVLFLEIIDQVSLKSKRNSDVERDSPQEGHLLLYGFTTSFTDFNIFIFAIFSPHFPQTISTDIEEVV